MEYFITSTAMGLQFGFTLINAFIPGHLAVGNIQGKLSDFSLDSLTYSYDKDIYRFTNVRLSWKPEGIIHLIKGDKDSQVIVTDMTLGEASISTKTSTDKPSLFSTAFLQPLVIHHIKADKLTVIIDDKPFIATEKTDIRLKNNNDYIITAYLYDGSMNGSLHLEWSPVFNLQTSLQLKQINLEKLSPDIKGNINFALLTNIKTDGIHHKIDLQIEKLNGKLKQYPISGHTFIHYENDNLEIEPSELVIAKAFARVSGSVKHQWDLRWNISVPDIAVLAADIHGNLALSGSLSGALNYPIITTKFNLPYLNFSASNHFIRTIKHTQGNLSGKLNLAGSITKPIIQADVILNNGQTSLPELGILLKNIKFDSHYDNHLATLNGSFQSGKGQGNIRGQIQLQPSLQLALHVNGKDLQVINVPEYKIFISPELTFSWNPTQLDIHGNILVPQANIEPTDMSETISLSDDVVFVHAKPEKPIIPTHFSLQTQITLGNAVYLHYQNLLSKVKGSLFVSQSPGRQPVASGQFILFDGTYKAYGKLLSIKNGRIIYTGNLLSNPGLDISAVRSFNTIAMSSASEFNSKSPLSPSYTGTDKVTVGIQIRGVVNKPIIALFSSPAGMSQNDILSYLLFDSPQSNSTLSGDSKSALITAASALKLGNINLGSFTDKIQNLTGLTELNVESRQIYNSNDNSTRNEAALSLGKKLSDKLSVHYSVGLYTSAALLNIRYQLTKRLTVQTETSYLENGVDLLYGFERD